MSLCQDFSDKAGVVAADSCYAFPPHMRQSMLEGQLARAWQAQLSTREEPCQDGACLTYP